MTRPLTNDDLATILDTRKEIHFGSPEWLALRALVAEARASRQHAPASTDDMRERARCLAIVRSQPNYPDTAKGVRQQWVRDEIARRIEEGEPTPSTCTHKAGTIEIDDGWYTGNCACGWQAIAQRLRRVDALKDADAHVRVASEVAPSQAAPVTDARVCPTCRAPTTSGLVCNPCEDSIAERLDATRAEPKAPTGEE